MKLIDLIFPKQCLGCLKWGQYICEDCRRSLRATSIQRCIVCQKPSLYGYTHPKCQTKYVPERLITVFDYSNPFFTKIINTAKLGLISELFNELTALAMESMEIRNPQLRKFTLCSIPIHKYRELYRGFNQSLIIANAFSERFNLPMDNLLKKSKLTKQQKSLSKSLRQKNLIDSFFAPNKQSLPTHVLLVDDVTTTGTTLMEATRTIKKCGVSIVWCIAIAQD